jgi:hypothetical protein
MPQKGPHVTSWVLRLIAVAVVAVGRYCELELGVWWSLGGLFFVWPIAGLMHLVAHFRKLPPGGSVWPPMTLITLSHVLFIAAFLLQYDNRDGPGFLIFTELLGHPDVPDWCRRERLIPGF